MELLHWIAFFAQPVRDAMTKAAPVDPTTKIPMWRIWDQNVIVDGEPTWVDSMAKAKAGFDATKGPVLFAFDDQGRVKTIPLQNVSDADAIAKIQELGPKGTPQHAQQ